MCVPFVCVHVIEPKRVGDVSPVPTVAVTIFKLAQTLQKDDQSNARSYTADFHSLR